MRQTVPVFDSVRTIDYPRLDGTESPGRLDPSSLDRWLRIAVGFGVGLPAAPWLLNFPHDSRYCTDARLGEGVCFGASLLFLSVALLVRTATFSWMAPRQRKEFVPKILIVATLWFVLPLIASYGRCVLGG